MCDVVLLCAGCVLGHVVVFGVVLFRVVVLMGAAVLLGGVVMLGCCFEFKPCASGSEVLPTSRVGRCFITPLCAH